MKTLMNVKNKMNGSLSRAARLLFGLATFLGVAGTAFAEGNVIAAPGVSGSNTAWTVYAFGNAQSVADAFRALTNFSASGTFQSIVSMVAVLGVLGVGLSGGFNPAMARRFIGYVVSVFLVCYILFGVSNGGPLVVNVEVIDSVDMTWKAPVTVPAVVGIPASIISTTGYKITQAIEASFAIPTGLKMTQGAPFNLAAAMVADASQARITDPNLASSLAYYVQDCFTIGVAQGALQATTLVNSTNFLKDIQYNSQSIMVNTLLPADPTTPGGTADIVTCADGWDRINKAVNAQGSYAADFLKNASAWSKTPALSVVNAAADTTAQWATNNGITDGGSLVKQAAILSAFRGAYAQAAAQTGNSDFLTGVAMSQAVESQRTSWIVGAEIFNKTMGYVFAILQVFVYALTPLVLCAALVPGLGLALLKNFSQILLWLAIWQPMLAIVNFIVISMQQADLGGILSSGGSQYGFTLTSMGIVSERTANLRAAASFVGTMVPALAWAMVKGSVDFSRVIGSAVGENFAQGAANTMTTGNYSLNQASMDSFTANKHSTAATGAWGHGHNTSGAVASTTHDAGGDSLLKAGEQQANVGSNSQQGNGHGTQTGNQAMVGTTGSSIDSATSARGTNEVGGGSMGGGQSNGSGFSTAVTGQIGPNVSVRLKGAGGGDGGGTTAAPGSTPGTTGDGDDKGGDKKTADTTDLQTDGKKPGRVAINLNAGGSANLAGNRQVTHNFNQADTYARNGSLSNTGSHADSGGQTGSTSRNAGTSDTTNRGDNRSITGISPTETRAQVQSALMRPADGALLDGDFAYDTLRSSPAGDKATELNKAGSVEAKVDAGEKKAANTEQKLKGEVLEMRDHARSEKKGFETAADALRLAEHDKAVAARAPASQSATTRALDAVGTVGGELKDGAQNMAYKMGQMANIPESVLKYIKPEEKTVDNGPPPAPSAADAAKAPAAAPAAPAAAAGKHPEQQRNPQAPAHVDAGKPGQTAQTQAGHQPEKHDGHPAAAAGKHPEQQRDPQHAAHPAAAAAGKHPEQQRNPQEPAHADAGKPGQTAQTQAGHQPEKHDARQPQQAGQQADAGHRPQAPAHADTGKPGQTAQTQAGHQPEKHDARQPQQAGQQADAGHRPQAPAHAEDRKPGQPAQTQAGHPQPGHPQPGQPTPRQAGQQPDQHDPRQQQPNGQQPQQLAAHDQRQQQEKPTQPVNSQAGHPPEQGKPDERKQLAANEHREKEREQGREQEPRQMVAAEAPQQMPTAQQPQAMPQVAAPEPQPQLAAAAPTPQPMPGTEGQSAMPNVFSGEKATDSAAQLQGQVQLAEQRAERLDNQRRNVDGVLSSAEGRKPSELLDLINQARDITRNA